MNIKFIKKLIESNSINISVHAVNRMHERNIMIDDIVESIKNGEIIEEYYDDYPYPSCLIMGKYKGRIIHIVCSFSDPVHIITAYEPDTKTWNDDYKTRRRVY